jgi:anti-sigma B factor antagonist
MKMNTMRTGPLQVIHVDEDRIDASVAIAFKDRFRSLLDSSTDPVVLDLSKVDFLDSSGLGAVVAVRKLLGDDRRLDLSGLRPAVDKVMNLTRMNTVFAIHASVDDALQWHQADNIA